MTTCLFFIQKIYYSFLIIVCLCFFFSSNSRIVHSHGDVTIAGERLHILTEVRQLWPLSSKSVLVTPTVTFDIWQPFIMVISKDQWHSYLLPNDKQWSCHYLFLRHRSVAAGIRTANLPLARRNLQPIATPPRYIAYYILILLFGDVCISELK